jgi:hypothetical protein
MVQSARVREIGRADDLIGQVRALAGEAYGVLRRAKDARDDELVLKAVARAERLIELQARLLGELQSTAPVVNVVVSPAWMSLQSTLTRILARYPQAQLEVADALELEAHAADH